MKDSLLGPNSSVEIQWMYSTTPTNKASFYIYIPGTLAQRLGCSPMARETWVQSQVELPKTLKMELDTTLLNTQHYKVRFKGKVEQSWEWNSALPYTLV